MPNIAKEDLFKDKDYFKVEIPSDPGYVYTIWRGSNFIVEGSGNYIVILCWVEDDLNHGIDYKIDEVLKYINEGSWVIVE